MHDALSKHEWMLMEVLWKRHPLFFSEIIDDLKHTLHWKRGTYLTYLKRMCDKGYLGFDEIRGSRSYFPLRSREECVKNESRLIITRMTYDSTKLFLTCMIQDSGLSEDAAAELKDLIDTLAPGMNGKEGE